MGTMNKLRENTGVILWILVLAFGGLWVLQDSGVFGTIGTNPNGNIIIVDGDPVTVDEYQRQLDAQIEQYRQRTGESMPPQMLDQEHNRAYNTLVDNKLREHEMDRLGIKVSDQEVFDLVLGDDPHPIIKVYFGDGQGGVDKALLQNFIDDPDAEAQWIQLEQYLRVERRRQKFENLIASTARVSNQEVEDEYLKTNLAATASFFALRYADVPNDSVNLTESDLQRFYSDHREEFKQARLYTLQIASLSKHPSREDSLDTMRRVEDMRTGFAEAENDSLYLARNASDRPYTSAFFSASDLDKVIAAAVFENPEKGRIIGPILSDDEVHLVKIVDTKPAEETNVRARHILFRAAAGNQEQLARAREEAREYKRRIENGEDFATLARQRSDDPGSGALGGDLGWFGPGAMVPAFQEAAFGARVGDVVGPIETQYGVHLIQVTQRADVEVQLADYAQELRASVTTFQNIDDRLGDLKYFAEDNGDFMGEAKRQSIPVQDVQVEEGQQIIAGFGNSRTLMRFLETAKKGDTSDVIELDEVYVVAHVAEIQPEGYRSFEDVKSEIEPRALLDKKRAYQHARMEKAYGVNGFDGLASALGTTANTASNVSFNNQIVPRLGRDAIFTGTVLGLKEGEDSGVVNGETGVFVAKVLNRSEPPPMSDADRTRLRDQLQNRRKSVIQSRWIASLREQADIEDLRNQFQQ